MPATSPMGMSSNEHVWERTVLYPSREAESASGPREPQTGTSLRRQFIALITGSRMRPRRLMEFPADTQEITLGKGASCRYRVEEPGVANVHAALVRRVNRGVYLVDLSEGARTLLNGEAVREEVLLMDGDRITLGDGAEFEFLDGPRSRGPGWANRVLSAAGLKKEA